MHRVKGWEQRLYSITADAIGRPHAWGLHDCVTFAADVIEAVTGDDLMGKLRGTYHGPQGAARVMQSVGAETLGGLAALYLPETDQPRRGDIVLCADPHEFLAVCVGRTAVGPSETGMIHVPMAQVVRAFRVGE